MTDTDKILQKLDEQGRKIDEQGKQLAHLQTDVTAIKSDIGTLKSDVTTLKSDVSTLKSDAGTLKTEVSAIKVEVAKIPGIQQQVSNLELNIEAFRAEQHEANQELLGHIITGNDVNGEAQQKLEKRVDRIEKHLSFPPVK